MYLSWRLLNCSSVRSCAPFFLKNSMNSCTSIWPFLSLSRALIAASFFWSVLGVECLADEGELGGIDGCRAVIVECAKQRSDASYPLRGQDFLAPFHHCLWSLVPMYSAL